MHTNRERMLSVQKEKIIDALRTNKEQHIKDFAVAEEVYFKDVAAFIKTLAKDVKNNVYRDDQYRIGIRPPENIEDKYDKYIGYFEIADEDVIELTIDEYDQYINDNWDWAVSAKLANSFYSTRAN